MDRLPAVGRALALLATLLAVAGCGGAGEEPQRSRFEGVKAVATPDVSRYCDTLWTANGAPNLGLPALEPARPGTAVPRLAADRFIWVNLWATWCGPCRREMPLVLKFAEQLRADGVKVDLWFVSIDDDPGELARFLKENPGVAPGNSVRVTTSRELEGWMKQLTTAPATSIPINIVAAPGGKVRCIRVGSLREGDYPVVRALFQPSR